MLLNAPLVLDKTGMITNYFAALANMSAYCREFKDWVAKTFFTRKIQYGYEKSDTPTEPWGYAGHYCYHPEYQQRLETIKRCIQICHVFGIAALNAVQPQLADRAYRLGLPEVIKTRKDFEENVDFIAGIFSTEGFPIAGMISQLHAMESERMVEAIHCLFEGCRYSAIAMAASAIEFRLVDFMNQVNPGNKEELQRKPLGSLIGECLDDKSAYSKRLPKRHRALLELCNQFRIFSVHPKTEVLGQNEAMSAINLAFSFILDPRMREVSSERESHNDAKLLDA
jgi:hypothetical protein